MDSTKAEKLRAMKSYKKSQFLSNLVLHSITALISTLLCSFPFWYPKLSSWVEQFFLVSLPNFKASFFNPKCLFVLGNAIIIFLVGESKLAGSVSSPAGEIYDEYAERIRIIHEVSFHMERKDENGGFETEESLEMIEDKYMIEEEEEEEAEEAQARDHDDDDHESEEEEEEEQAESGLPAEELNKRVEDFIARFNRQRWLEARELDHGRG